MVIKIQPTLKSKLLFLINKQELWHGIRYVFRNRTEQIGDPVEMTQKDAIIYKKVQFNNLKILGWKLKRLNSDHKEKYKKESLKTYKTSHSKLSDEQKRHIINSKLPQYEIAKIFNISKSYVSVIKSLAKHA
jgi:hypothetical protein